MEKIRIKYKNTFAASPSKNQHTMLYYLFGVVIFSPILFLQSSVVKAEFSIELPSIFEDIGETIKDSMDTSKLPFQDDTQEEVDPDKIIIPTIPEKLEDHHLLPLPLPLTTTRPFADKFAFAQKVTENVDPDKVAGLFAFAKNVSENVDPDKLTGLMAYANKLTEKEENTGLEKWKIIAIAVGIILLMPLICGILACFSGVSALVNCLCMPFRCVFGCFSKVFGACCGCCGGGKKEVTTRIIHEKSETTRMLPEKEEPVGMVAEQHAPQGYQNVQGYVRE